MPSNAALSTTEHEEAAQLREQLEEAQNALQDFVYAVSHDLGTPLRAVTGFSAILQQKYADKLDEKGTTYVNFIADGGNKVQLMLNGLLNYSRINTQGKLFGAVDINEVLNDVCTELEKKICTAGAQVNYGAMPTIWADGEQMRQLFRNIVDNALTYCPPGTAPYVSIVAEHSSSAWNFTVTDNGIGVEPENSEQVFRIFRRLHPDNLYPGIGMGLPLARRIAERHGGSMGIRPAIPHGTTVWLALPRMQAENTVEKEADLHVQHD